MKVAKPTQKPSTSLTGVNSIVAIKPPVPIVDLYIMSSIILRGCGELYFTLAVNAFGEVTQVLSICSPDDYLVFGER